MQNVRKVITIFNISQNLCIEKCDKFCVTMKGRKDSEFRNDVVFNVLSFLI